MAEAMQPPLEPSIILGSKSEKLKTPIPIKLIINNSDTKYFMELQRASAPSSYDTHRGYAMSREKNVQHNRLSSDTYYTHMIKYGGGHRESNPD